MTAQEELREVQDQLNDKKAATGPVQEVPLCPVTGAVSGQSRQEPAELCAWALVRQRAPEDLFFSWLHAKGCFPFWTGSAVSPVSESHVFNARAQA